MNREEMERIASAHKTKAAKIRALNEAGYSTTAISDFIGIRYQHTYNVLLRAGRVGSANETPAQTIDAAQILEVSAEGVVRLPDSILKELGLLGNAGQLFVRQTPEGLLLLPRQAVLDHLQRLAVERMPEHADLLSALLNRTSGNSPGTP
ncbi:hypothetical protein [Sphingomonas turrisvirgatae]|nr:hypothetical protein [Sphingomonas turrisvirgatae]